MDLRKLYCILVYLAIFLASPAFAEQLSNAITGVKALPLPDDRVRLVIQFKKDIGSKPASFVTKKPARVIFDFLNTSLESTKNSDKINVGVLKRYTLVSTPKRTRIVLDLSQVVTFSTDVVGKRFNITLAGKTRAYVPQRRQTLITNRATTTKHAIRDLDFRGVNKNGGKLIIALSDPSLDVDVKQQGNKILLNFISTRLPPHLYRRLDVSDFHTPAQMIDSSQRGNKAHIKILTKGDYGYFSYQVNNQYIVEVFPLSAEEVAKAKLKKKIFSGKRISLNFQDIKVRAVLQLLADFTQSNMVVSDSVTGNITLRLNHIPWDQALDIILKTRGLDKRKMGNVLLIAPTQEISAREKLELQVQQQVRELAPIRSELIQINYAKALDVASLIKDKDNSLLSARGNISVDTRTNALWVQDTSIQLAEIKDLIKKLDVPVKQVLIEARVVIVNKDFEEDIGIRFGVSRPTHLSGTLAGANDLAGGTPAADVPLARRLNLDLAAAPTVATPATLGLALAKLGNGILLDLELSALESEGRGEVISSPRLITANQQAAMIEAGEEIPYQQATSSGATAIAFKKAVLSLQVTPQITPDNKIILDLIVNQDTPSPQKFHGVPAIFTKEIQTNVLVSNGQTIVLGGIYRQDKKQSTNRVPFLGTLPLVGVLFRNESESIRHEELLIFITPKIIRHSFMTS